MVKLTINHSPIDVPEGYTVLQACEEAGAEVPFFCYHPKLSIAGNCRMCLVEMEKSPKPVASCAMPVAEGMVIHTNTDVVQKARQGVLELLLINHPLDCPICDQGGECDLQDITMSYGRGKSRYDLNKRAVSDKNMGPLIKTQMTRCIHCTRCVRFAHEIAGTSELGTLHRGEHMEITTFLDTAITSELSGNLIDICPVGALTNKPYAFHGRPWELTKTPSIDVMDAVGSHIRIDTRGPFEVMRVLPRAFEAINEDWISDKTRFAYDGLKYQRLDRPYIRNKKGKLQPASWDEALNAVVGAFKGAKASEIAAITGDLCDVEAMYALKKFMQGLGSENLESRANGSKLTPQSRSDYLFNTTIAGTEQADVCLIIGANPRLEASLVNARLKKRSWSGDFSVGLVGEAVDLTYTYEHLGDKPTALEFLREAQHPFTQKLITAKKPMILLGEAVFTHADADKIEHLVKSFCLTHKIIRDDWNGYNVLSLSAARVGAFDVGFLPGEKGLSLEGMYEASEAHHLKVAYILGADCLNFSRLQNTFMIYQGHHGDEGANAADVILPGCAYTEKNALYVNLEGRIQQTCQAVQAPGEAKEDWRILRVLSQMCGQALPFNHRAELHQHLQKDYPLFATDGMMCPHYQPIVDERLAKAKLSNRPFAMPVSDFYMDNVIAKNSKIMASCSLQLKQKGGNNDDQKKVTHG